MKYLILGLGNTGVKYNNTRHNIGFEILDALASASNVVFREERFAEIGERNLKGRHLLLVKPTTFMNLSGNALMYWMKREKVPLKNVIVVVDDVALPLGKIRIRTRGSHGGHNGLRHIEEIVKTTTYSRLRIGIGNDFPRGRQVDYVLGAWSEADRKVLDEIIPKSVEAIETSILIGLERTMNLYNS